MMDHLDSEHPIALSDSEESIAKLDNEALLANFRDVNANFIAVGPLARQFQELRYSQLRDELCRIDLEIRRRALLGTPEYKAAVKAAHDQAWQVVHLARPRTPNSPVPGSRTADRESADPVVQRDPAPASTGAAAPASQTGDQESADPVVQQDPAPASTGAAAPASQTGDQESADPVVQQDPAPASTGAAAPASQTGDQESADPVVQLDPAPASTGAAAPASQTADRESVDPAVQQDIPASTSAVPTRTILAGWRDAIFALGHRRHDAQ
jgi:hypothetical protein